MHLLKKYPHSSHSNLAISLGSHIDVYTIIFVIISGHFSISPLLYYYSLAFPPNCTICLSIQLRSRARALTVGTCTNPRHELVLELCYIPLYGEFTSFVN